MFRHALSRQEELQNLCTRIENVRKTPYSKEEIQLMIDLRKKGLSFGRISEELWEQHEISRRPSSLAIKYYNLFPQSSRKFSNDVQVGLLKKK